MNYSMYQFTFVFLLCFYCSIKPEVHLERFNPEDHPQNHVDNALNFVKDDLCTCFFGIDTFP